MLIEIYDIMKSYLINTKQTQMCKNKQAHKNNLKTNWWCEVKLDLFQNIYRTL